MLSSLSDLSEFLVDHRDFESLHSSACPGSPVSACSLRKPALNLVAQPSLGDAAVGEWLSLKENAWGKENTAAAGERLSF